MPDDVVRADMSAVDELLMLDKVEILEAVH